MAGIVRYLILADTGRCAFTVMTSYDKIQALVLCKQLNMDRENNMIPEGTRYFVVRDIDGQTWEYYDGGMYRVDYKPDQSKLEYKEIAI